MSKIDGFNGIGMDGHALDFFDVSPTPPGGAGSPADLLHSPAQPQVRPPSQRPGSGLPGQQPAAEKPLHTDTPAGVPADTPAGVPPSQILHPDPVPYDPPSASGQPDPSAASSAQLTADAAQAKTAAAQAKAEAAQAKLEAAQAKAEAAQAKAEAAKSKKEEGAAKAEAAAAEQAAAQARKEADQAEQELAAIKQSLAGATAQATPEHLDTLFDNADRVGSGGNPDGLISWDEAVSVGIAFNDLNADGLMSKYELHQPNLYLEKFGIADAIPGGDFGGHDGKVSMEAAEKAKLPFRDDNGDHAMDVAELLHVSPGTELLVTGPKGVVLLDTATGDYRVPYEPGKS